MAQTNTDTHTGTVWSFRFKESAGTDWTATDPWYTGLEARKMVFLKDGSVRQYVSAVSAAAPSERNHDNDNNHQDNAHAPTRLRSDAFRGSTSSPTGSAQSSDSESLPELISPNFGSLALDAQHPQPPANTDNDNPHRQRYHHHHHHNGRLVLPPVSMSWRLVTRPMDLPNRPQGSYLRFSVGGREVPTYSVRRSPTGNWGFVMESCWGLYASFELPPKRSSSHQLQQQQRRRLRRTEAGARWVEILENGEEALSPDDQHPRNRPEQRPRPQSDAELMGDAALEITNEVQWREAFLYNVGARTLPEGEDATDEFDRAFRGIH